MAIQLDPQRQTALLASIRQFFAEELEETIGEVKARKVLDYVLREIGPSIYNQAIAHAQQSLEQAVADLPASRYEPELGYWRKR